MAGVMDSYIRAEGSRLLAEARREREMRREAALRKRERAGLRSIRTSLAVIVAQMRMAAYMNTHHGDDR